LAPRLPAGPPRLLHLNIGEPDFVAPEPVRAAAERALRDGRTQYTPALGLPALRERLSDWVAQHFGVDVPARRIAITAGASAGLQLAVLALFDTGDEVLLPDPCYPCNRQILASLGVTPRGLATDAAHRFQPTAAALARAWGPRTRGVMLATPANPTGIVLSPEQLAALADLDILLVSDEIYHGLVYGERAHSVLEYTDRCVVINGFSKLYAMTGWRLGYAILPPELVRPVQKLQQNLMICASSVAQHAALAALRECEPYVREMVRTYDTRRRHLVRRLREIGFGVAVEPTGAFYVLANARRFCSDSYAFAMELLERTRVAVAPGIDFGANAEGYLRFSYANSLENIEEAMRRLAVYLDGRPRSVPS